LGAAQAGKLKFTEKLRLGVAGRHQGLQFLGHRRQHRHIGAEAYSQRPGHGGVGRRDPLLTGEGERVRHLREQRASQASQTRLLV
jgi:hypothetical protein